MKDINRELLNNVDRVIRNNETLIRAVDGKSADLMRVFELGINYYYFRFDRYRSIMDRSYISNAYELREELIGDEVFSYIYPVGVGSDITGNYLSEEDIDYITYSIDNQEHHYRENIIDRFNQIRDYIFKHLINDGVVFKDGILYLDAYKYN